MQFKELLHYTTNECMVVSTTSIKDFMRQELKQISSYQQTREVKNKFTLKELQAKEYPFLDYDIPAILDELLTKKFIALLESKRAKENNKVYDLMCCKFHRIIDHHNKKMCVKENIMILVR